MAKRKKGGVGVIGIDPGVTGACVAITPGRDVRVEDIPAANVTKRKSVDAVALHARICELVSWLEREHGVSRCVVYLEQTWAMPKGGTTVAYSQGDTNGVIRGVVAAMGLSLHMVLASKWKKRYLPPTGKLPDRGKDAARQKAMSLFPQAQASLLRKKDHNRADALLLADFGRAEQN